MPFICPNLRSLEDQADSIDCVALIQATVPGLRGMSSSSWREGAPVVGDTRVARGTAIAAFKDGRYAGYGRFDQAAIFLEYGGAGIWILETPDDDSGAMQRSFIPSGQAAFSVIELHG
jgi:hypothetical protein